MARWQNGTRAKSRKRARRNRQKKPVPLLPVLIVIVAAVIAYLVFGAPRCSDDQGAGSSSSQQQETTSAQNTDEETAPTTNLVAYNALDASNKKAYESVLRAFENRTFEEVDVSSEETGALYETVIADHPELFYVDKMRTQTRTVGDVSTVSVGAEYTCTEEEQAQLQNSIDAYTDQCLAGVSAEWDDYEKAKYFYDYIVTKTDYDLSAPDNQSIVSVFVNGRSVCSGYARAFQYLMQKVDIPCVCVSGTARGGSHAWVVAQLDGAYYHIDPTWADPQFLNDESGSWGNYINYDYLGVTTADIAKTHTLGDGITYLPQCTSTADNYYVREGLVLDRADASQLEEILLRAKSEGDGYARFKCADDETYAAVRDLLFERGLAMETLGTSRLHYTTADESRTIVIPCQ